jgi:hypothetical protein
MRLTTLYGVAVGLPVASIAAVLHMARDIKAPPAIGGAWTVQFADSGAAACAGQASRAPVAFDISQSGVYLTMTLHGEDRLRFVGRLTSGTAEPIVLAAASTEPSHRNVSLAAEVDRSTSPHRMHGVFRGVDCPGTAAARFDAAQSPAPSAKDANR